MVVSMFTVTMENAINSNSAAHKHVFCSALKKKEVYQALLVGALYYWLWSFHGICWQ